MRAIIFSFFVLSAFHFSSLISGAEDNTNSTPARVAVPSPAASPPHWLMKPNHVDGLYSLNETVNWTVDFTGDRTGLTAIPYVIKEDGKVATGKGTVDLSAGPATITATRSTPGLLVAYVYPVGKPGTQSLAIGGALFAPDQINLSVPVPADFDAFWRDKLKELTAVPVNPVVEQVDVSAIKYTGTIDYYKVTLDNINGTHVYGQLARPKGKSSKKFPAMLVLQGAGVYPLDKQVVISAAKAGYLALDISAHDLPIGEPPDFYDNLKKTKLSNYVLIGNENRDSSFFLRMFLGCARAVDYLTSRPDWDGKILLVTGGSQGGFQSFFTAAFCPQVTAMSVVVPAGCDILGEDANPPRAFSWPYWLSDWALKGRDKKKVEATAPYYDAINFAARVHCPSWVGVGLIDDIARPTGVVAAFNAIKAPKKLFTMPLYGHAGSGAPECLQELSTWRNDLRDGIPLPTTTNPE
jgi:cephalosporin-C deacetylase